jgi:MFS family permease
MIHYYSMNGLAWFTERSCQANIPKFFLFRFIWEFHLPLPIWVIFLQHRRGFSLTQVTLLDVAFWLTVAAGELPTGAVADTFGRQRSLLIGVLLAAASISVFALAPTYPLLMLANALWGLAFTFDSGAALALLYDSLRAVGREAEYTRVRGHLAVVVQTSIALSSALGGLLGAIDLSLPFLVYAALLLASLSLVGLLQEPPVERDPIAGTRPSYTQTLTRAARAIRQIPGLRYASLYASVLPLAGFIVGVVLLQPHALALGVPVAMIGFLSMGLRGIGMSGSAVSYRLATRFGESSWLRIVPTIMFMGMMGLSLFNSLGGSPFLR